MKKIINGKKYDTETAYFCGNVSYSNPRDFYYCSESLYKKTTGEFFLYGEGGPASKYSEPYDLNGTCSGKKIIPLTEEKAMKWAEKYLDVDEYEELFGEVAE